MKRPLTILSALAMALGLCGCAGRDAGTAVPLTAPSDPESVAYVYDGTGLPVTAFGLSLLRETVKTGEADPVLSPLSAYLALAMAADGAGGETLSQFDALLHASGGDRDALAWSLVYALRHPEGSTLSQCAHSVWTQEGAGITEQYLHRMEEVFSAQVFSADLSSPAARKAINGWVEENTHGLIPTLLEQDLDPETAMVLLNTLYFKGAWQTAFDPSDTGERIFHGEQGDAAADFLHRTGAMTVAENEQWEGVLLPYDDGRTAFLAVKPKEGSVRDLAAGLTAEDFLSLLEGTEQEVALALPRLDAECFLTLDDSLQALGLTDAYDPDRADFSPMGVGPNGDPLCIGTVLQKVKLTLGEEGTEAAAATAVIMAECTAVAPTDPPREILLDSPFLYAVVDRESGAPLFLGLATEG